MEFKINKFAKPHLEEVMPYSPGKPIEEVQRELGLKEVIKLASNENLLGISPKALSALRKCIKEVNFYPDDASYYLTKKLAKIHNVSEDEILVANGSVEILYYLGYAFCDSNTSIAYNIGAFAMYPIIRAITNAKKIEVPLKEDNLACNPEGIFKKLRSDTRIIFLSNPNNPTGTSFTHKEAENLVANLDEGNFVVFDEAYTHFVESKDFPDTFSLYKKYKNVIILRTLSKAYGLAGLRVGYVIARPDVIYTLKKLKVPFNVNRCAQIAALYALDDEEFMKKTVNMIKKEKRFLYKNYKALGIEFLPSDTNFIFVRFEESSKVMFEKLLRKGVITRPLPDSIFKGALRITIGRRRENRILIRALKEVI